MGTMRLQAFIAKSGLTSRRKAEDMIKAGLVKVNGKTVTELGTKVDPEADTVHVDYERIFMAPEMIYIILNKPKGVVTTAQDTHGRKTVIDLVRSKQRLFPVGRLDIDSEGLVLLTNDGDLAYRLSHPKHKVKKVYEVQVKGLPEWPEIELLRKGIELEEGRTAPASITFINKKKDRSNHKVVLKEGKKRQIRRMFQAIGYPVEKLVRISIGTLQLDGLAAGDWRHVSEKEIEILKKQTDF